MNGRRDELWLRRALLGAVGAMDLAAIAATQTVVGRIDPLALPLWYHVLLVGCYLVPAVVAILALFGGFVAVRRLTIVAFVASVVPPVVLLVLVVLEPSRTGQLPWMVSSSASAAAAAAIVWGPRVAWFVLGALTAVIWTLSGLVGDLIPNRVANDTQVLVISIAIIALSVALIRSGRAIDEASGSALASAERRAAAQARQAAAERTRVIVHDDVLACLLLAARGIPRFDRLVAEQAALAAERVRSLAEPELAEDVPLADLVDRLREVARVESPDVAFSARIVRHAVGEVPSQAAVAIVAAARQALANSARHAPGAATSLILFGRRDGVRVVVQDDGPGFDRDAIPPDRLGVTGTILGRMRAVPDCEAGIESGAGNGTTVTLGWRDPRDSGGGAADDDVITAPVPARRLAPDMRVALVIAVVAELALAVYATTVVAYPLVPIAGILAVGASLAAMGWRPLRLPSVGRSVWSAAFAVAACLLIAVGDPAEYRLVVGWTANAGVFVMVVLAMRGRPFIALGGIASGIVLGGIASRAQGVSVVDVASVLARPAIVGLGAVAVVLLLGWLSRRAARIRADEVEAARMHAWRGAERAELLERVGRLDALIGRTLDRLATGEPLGEEERRECALLEGALRDLYRGARLSREPLVSATRRARARGIDVVLFDDAPGEPIGDAELDEIAVWMSRALDGVREGGFTGRILPADRPGRASAASEDGATLFRG